jgi:Maltose operon periplasmic protein precursor (MalM)
MRSLCKCIATLSLPALMVAGGGAAQVDPANAQEASSIPLVARTLAEQGMARDLPANLKGRIKHTIKEDEDTFSLPAGRSPVVLVQLPDYSVPYTLTVTSLPRGFGTWKLFVPSVVLLDSAFQPTREVAEAEFIFKPQTFSKSPRLEGEMSIDESSRNDRYLFIYADGAQIGELYGVHGSKAYGVVVIPLKVDVKLVRSLHGSVEIEPRSVK